MTRAAVRTAVVAVAALVAALLPAGAAHADQPLWEIGGGVAALSAPHYRGSDQSQGWVLPVPYVIYRGEWLKSDRDGIRAKLLSGERWHFDVSADASPPAASDDNRARAGMADLKATIAVGPRLDVRLARGAGWKVDLRLPVRAVATLESNPRFIGWVAAPVVNLDVGAAGWNFGLQGGPLAATRRHHGYFYDVAAGEATAARPAYAARGGRSGWAATASASRRSGPWWLAAFVRADTVGGAAFEDSPLVRRRTTAMVGIAVSRVLATSDTRVAVDF